LAKPLDQPGVFRAVEGWFDAGHSGVIRENTVRDVF
jgi:hypothetical protein